MMRVGILTFHPITNIGAVLQAYALCKVINDLGYDTRIIDYRPEYLVAPYERWGLRPRTIWNNLKRMNNFKRFRKAFLPTTEHVYYDVEELKKYPPDVDIYVCGSDQVWNLIILQEKLDAAFFLDVAPEGKKRIAYAPSFGDTLDFPDVLQDEVVRLLKRFDAISVREESGQILIRRLIGQEVPVVLDPSLLIEDYSKIIRKPGKGPDKYIAVYYLEKSEKFDHLVRKVHETLKLPIVNISHNPLKDADFNYINLGPSEWLGWMQDASFVCTNSFHGTAYSIIFGKNFLSFPHQIRPRLNARIEGLLKLADLSERLIPGSDTFDDKNIILQDVDYESVKSLLRASITKSQNFLKKALSC